MKIAISPFPVLTPALIEDSGIALGEFSFSYCSNHNTNPLTLKPISVASSQGLQNYNLVDERGEWDAVHFSTHISRKISIENPEVLFGPNGIGAKDSTLGMAVQLMSLSSNHRFSIPVFIFNPASGAVEGDLSYDIPRNFYRDKILLKSILYLYNSGNPKGDEVNLANLPGTVLGTLDEIVVFIDGTGSLFPIKKESDPAKPLWRVECDWSDPFNDLFTDENVCVILNQSHPNIYIYCH